MPAQSGQSKLFAKLGNKLSQAHEERKSEETEYGFFSELPAGIEGIAQLIDAKFDYVKDGKQSAGEPYFYAAGVVKRPIEAVGQRVEGLRTSLIEPLYDTPTRTRKTISDHLAFIYNELRKLGVDTTTMPLENLEITVAALKQARPHFRFRTWQGDRQTSGPYANQEPRVQHNWNGLVEFSDNGENSGEGTKKLGKTVPSLSKTWFKNAATLAALADAGDEEAANELRTLAISARVTEEAIDSAADWAEVAMVLSMLPPPSGEKDAAVEAWVPKPEEIYLYWPVDHKTKKPVKTPVECEVMVVDDKTRMVTLKRLDTKVVISGVKWDELESEQPTRF